MLTYAVLIQDNQTALNLLNNKQTILLMSLSFQPRTRKETRNPQLSQFDPAIQVMLPSAILALPIFNVIN